MDIGVTAAPICICEQPERDPRLRNPNHPRNPSQRALSSSRLQFARYGCVEFFPGVSSFCRFCWKTTGKTRKETTTKTKRIPKKEKRKPFFGVQILKTTHPRKARHGRSPECPTVTVSKSRPMRLTCNCLLVWMLVCVFVCVVCVCVLRV